MKPKFPLLLLISLAVASIASAATATQIGLSVIPDWTADGSQTGCEFGYSVNTAGDVNGDGYDDVIVGSAKYELDVYREGAAFLYYGSTSGVSDLPEWSSAGGYSGGRFGNSVASARDVNNDGYDEIIVGASRYKNGETDEGAAFVYYGDSVGPSTDPDWRIESNLANSQYGYAVASAGDVNGDDFDDIIVGARWYTVGQENEGAIFVYLGSSSGLNLTHSWMYESNQSDTALGSSVASAGDVNGDGYSDIVAGAPFCDRGETDEGCIYVFLGSPSGLPDLPDWIIGSDQAEASFGVSVSSAGDVNGDGYDDIIVGASSFDNPNGQADEGAAFVFAGSAQGVREPHIWKMLSNQAYSGYGISVSGVGDVDKDGFSDIAVGAYRFSNDQSNEGAVFLYRGGLGGPSSAANWWAEGDKAETEFGFSSASAGDVNKDGYQDLIIGAPQYKRDERIVLGRSVVYLGAAASADTLYTLHLPVIRR